MPMIYLEKVSSQRQFYSDLENLYQMIKNHLPNGYIQHHLLVRRKWNSVHCFVGRI